MGDTGPADLEAAFAAVMDRLGPFEDAPKLAVAVSGGADSMALALLAHRWAVRRSGAVHAMVVDHGLRAESAAEASATIGRLAVSGIGATLLALTGLPPGPSLAERARIARYGALTATCRARGFLHLLLGHHAADQAETLMMRVLHRSGTHGLAGMAALTEARDVRLMRPLLGVAPLDLRRFLQARGVAWVEDPSNANLDALRPRLRVARRSEGTAALNEAAGIAGQTRACAEAAIAAELAAGVVIRPEGFCRFTARRLSPGALASLIQMIAGAPYPPSIDQIADLAAAPRSATVAGTRLTAAGAGLLLVREEAAMQAPMAARRGARWDGRMRLLSTAPEGATVGSLGDDAAAFRKRSALPSMVLRTLPAVRSGKVLLAVPHLSYVSDERLTNAAFLFDPSRPAAGPTFCPI